MANIFRLVKLARGAYKAAPVVIPAGLAVARYAMDKLRDQNGGKAGARSAATDSRDRVQDPQGRHDQS